MRTKFLGAALMLASCVLGMSAQVESRAFYSTNPADGVGKAATIAIDGQFNDWSEDMVIATCGANDMATAFHGSHENCVIDMYTLYAAWDDSNLYLAWQMCNTGDTWARPGDGPLTDYGHIGNVPLIVSLSVNPGSTAMTGRLEDGRCIWCDKTTNGVEFATHVDHLFYMSAQPGQGVPAMFIASNTSGATNYGAACKQFSNIGVKYALKNDFLPSHLWRQKTHADWADAETLISDPSILENIYDADCYDNLMAGAVEGLKPHDKSYDSFFEMAIPFKALGINREYLETYGIGCRVIGTRGESGIDCIPFDPSMVDNVFEKYGADSSTSHEKDDIDIITYDMASIGKIRDNSVVPPLPDDPIDDPDDPDEPTDGNWNAYFVDDDPNPWSSVNVWIWDAGNGNKNYTGGSWPGSPMKTMDIEGFGKGWHYSFATDDAIKQPMIIFSSGQPQTKDLVFENNGVYNRQGKIGTYAGIGAVEADATFGEQPEYFNLQGIKVAQPVTGQLYIEKKGNSISKVIF